MGEKEYKKYGFPEMCEIFGNSTLELNRKEEIWLGERLLGINLARDFYSFFCVVFKGMAFTEVEREFQGIIRKIIHAVMNWGGIYSRSILITKMKIIYELHKRYTEGETVLDKREEIVERRLATPEEILQFQECGHYMVIRDGFPMRVHKQGEPHICLEFGDGDKVEYVERREHVERRRIDTPKDILTYLYDKVITRKMETLADAYKIREIRGYRILKDKTDMEECLKEIGGRCDSLIKEYFNSPNGYFLLKTVGKSTEEISNAKLYKLIQKIVIGELNN